MNNATAAASNATVPIIASGILISKLVLKARYAPPNKINITLVSPILPGITIPVNKSLIL